MRSVQAGQGACRRLRLEVHGRVQGVGFRPVVYRLATALNLAGTVGNGMQGAFIEIEGPQAMLDEFLARLPAMLPPPASIAHIARHELAATGACGFRIVQSTQDGSQEAEIVPDLATCRDCLREIGDRRDRRYAYPFTNCTHCGPRYSIVQAVPYDRRHTTMRKFEMCPACAREYADPHDRRFHAQPNACPACGPQVWFADRYGKPVPGDGIKLCAARLQAGAVIAIKGLGGFHLSCRADLDAAVLKLRAGKGREAKPFALMVSSLDVAETLVELDSVTAAELVSWQAPIILAPKRAGAIVSQHVAPGCNTYGVMLAYTPLHHLLFRHGAFGPLVMTSGNPTEEPLCSENSEAVQRLEDRVDGFLLHDRDIERRVDDSVITAVRDETTGATRVFPVRRSRGYVPQPLRLPVSATVPVLALGGDLKSAVCLARDDQAVLSEHLGELANPMAFRNFTATIERFKDILGLNPEIVATDLHPRYLSTAHGRALPGRQVRVQHHHAHAVACMVDNGLTGPVIGIAADGTGYGTDGQIWGCELLLCDELDFRRVGHLDYFPLAGGDLAALETWRPALGLLQRTAPEAWKQLRMPRDRVDEEALRLTAAHLAHNDRLPLTSSLGRLFDAAACVLGVCYRNRFEAEAAMALEALAGTAGAGGLSLSYGVREDDGVLVLDQGPMVQELVAGVAAGRDTAEQALAFHAGLAALLAEGAARVADMFGVRRVVLSGGCFLNRLLLRLLLQRLAQHGLSTYIHRQVPPGDGGLALGQAAIAAARCGKGQG